MPSPSVSVAVASAQLASRQVACSQLPPADWLPELTACRLMVERLDLADRANVVVAGLAGVLDTLQAQDELPDINMP